MPYLNGKRVSIEEWRDKVTGHGVPYSELMGLTPDESAKAEVSDEEEAPAPKRRTRGKAAAASKAIAEATGVTVDLDAPDATLNVTSNDAVVDEGYDAETA